MTEKEKYISEALMKKKPEKPPLKFKLSAAVVQRIDDLQNQIDSLQIHGLAVSNMWGDDPHIGISQKFLSEQILAMKEQIDYLIDKETVINVVFTPTAAKIGIANNISIYAAVSSEATSIKVWRGATQIGDSGSGTEITVVDTITPDSLTPIAYAAEVTIAGRNIKREGFNLPVEKREATLSWNKSADIVNTKDAASHVYPVLNNPNNLPITYTSTNNNIASIDSQSGVITPHIAGTTVIKAVFAGNELFNAKTVQYNLTVLSAADYYVGWATENASSFDAFTALTTEQLLDLAEGYSKITNPSITKTITSTEAVGSRQIFFLMWRSGSAPKNGTVTSGGITENLTSADFTDDSVFRATHANITVDDNVYQVHGMRGAFDTGDVFIINF